MCYNTNNQKFAFDILKTLGRYNMHFTDGNPFDPNVYVWIAGNFPYILVAFLFVVSSITAYDRWNKAK